MLKQMRIPIILVAFSLAAGMLVGAGQADNFPFPVDLIEWANLDEGFIEGVEELEMFRFYSIGGVGYVFFHNLRSILIATFLGIFTFGVFGELILLLPFGLIGYFMATVTRAGLSPWTFFNAFILPHGILEIPALILAGAAILRLGATLATPANGETIGSAWLKSLADWARTMVAWVLPLLLGAAFLEMYLTPRVALWLFGN